MAAGLVWWMSGSEPAESKLDGDSGVPSRTATELRTRKPNAGTMSRL